jgi:hypothetical protein
MKFSKINFDIFLTVYYYVIAHTREALGSSGASVLAGPARRGIPEDGILHSHRRDGLKSYNTFASLLFLRSVPGSSLCYNLILASCSSSVPVLRFCYCSIPFASLSSASNFCRCFSVTVTFCL